MEKMVNNYLETVFVLYIFTGVILYVTHPALPMVLGIYGLGALIFLTAAIYHYCQQKKRERYK